MGEQVTQLIEPDKEGEVKSPEVLPSIDKVHDAIEQIKFNEIEIVKGAINDAIHEPEVKLTFVTGPSGHLEPRIEPGEYRPTPEEKAVIRNMLDAAATSEAAASHLRLLKLVERGPSKEGGPLQKLVAKSEHLRRIGRLKKLPPERAIITSLEVASIEYLDPDLKPECEVVYQELARFHPGAITKEMVAAVREWTSNEDPQRPDSPNAKAISLITAVFEGPVYQQILSEHAIYIWNPSMGITKHLPEIRYTTSY